MTNSSPPQSVLQAVAELLNELFVCNRELLYAKDLLALLERHVSYNKLSDTEAVEAINKVCDAVRPLIMIEDELSDITSDSIMVEEETLEKIILELKRICLRNRNDNLQEVEIHDVLDVVLNGVLDGKLTVDDIKTMINDETDLVSKAFLSAANNAARTEPSLLDATALFGDLNERRQPEDI